MQDLTLEEVYAQLLRHPGLAQAIGMETATRYVRLAASLKRYIIHAQKPGYNQEIPPPRLPHILYEFLGSALALSDDYVQGCWEAFKLTVWQHDPELYSPATEAGIFYKHARKHDLGVYA